MNLLDEVITTKNTYYGIVDYTNKKHIILFDTTKNDSPDIILLLISWRTLHENMRFSVYRDIFFPDIDIPVILIPRKDILRMPQHIVHEKVPKIQKKSIKKKQSTSSFC